MKDARNQRQSYPVIEGPSNIVGLLKACTKERDVQQGTKLHAYICEHKLLERDCCIASSLVSMYARCGALGKAQQLLDELPLRNGITWTALIAGYTEQGQGKDALECFDVMQCEGHSPDVITFICALKACGSTGAAAKGEQIHDMIVNLTLLEKSILLGSTLVDMYARCGVLEKAQQVLNELPVRNVVTWTTVIAGYAQQDRGEEALKCFDSMQHEGHSPDVVTFICALKACGSIGAIVKGEQIHDKIVSLGMLDKDIVLGTTLVDMYARCGALAKAQQVHYELPFLDVVSWNALIGGYVRHGQVDEALKCFDDMHREGHLPNMVTFICALKACGSRGAIVKGQHIHQKVLSLSLLGKHVVLGTMLVDMYAKCGALTNAQQVLDKLSVRSMIMWTVLITEYTQQGQAEEALKCFESMQREGHSPDAITFVCVLKACASISAVDKGEQIHFKVAGLGMLETDDMVATAVVDMYARSGALAKAQRVLDELPVRNVIVWTALIAGCAQQGHYGEALKCLESMQHEGHSPDAITFVCALKACGSIGAFAKGRQIHDKIISMGIMEKEVILGSALIDMYAKCGALAKAQQVFEELPIRDAISWTAIIAGYSQQGQGEEALKNFDSMQCDGYPPSAVTFICALKACGSIGATIKGEKIHEKIVSMRMLEKDIVLGNTVIDMYVRFGALTKAHKVVDELPVRNVVTWATLIAGYTQQGQGEEALQCFDSMELEGHSPNSVCFIFALKACGTIGVITRGEQFHTKMVNLGLLEADIILGSTLVDMYAKCPLLEKAVEVLNELPISNVVTWNALIGGFAQEGNTEEASNCLKRMQSKGVRPDLTTLICMLNACAHSGLLHHAEKYFLEMNSKFGIIPDVEHYCCMVDLFGRAGEFNKALLMIEKMLSDDYLSVWIALMGSCRKWGDMRIARLAFERALILDKTDDAAYICMANIYQEAAMHEDALRIEWQISQ